MLWYIDETVDGPADDLLIGEDDKAGEGVGGNAGPVEGEIELKDVGMYEEEF